MKIYNLPLPDNQLKKSNDIKIFNYGKYEKIDRKITTYTTVLTLPLILAACGGGGGGGAPAVSSTPAATTPADQAHSDITVASSATSVDEGGSVTYTVTAGTVGNVDTNLSWAIADGSSDFDSTSGTVTLKADASSAIFMALAHAIFSAGRSCFPSHQ